EAALHPPCAWCQTGVDCPRLRTVAPVWSMAAVYVPPLARPHAIPSTPGDAAPRDTVQRTPAGTTSIVAPVAATPTIAIRKKSVSNAGASLTPGCVHALTR